MRVLMVTPGYYPIKGGTEAIVRSLSIKLNESRIRTDVMTFNMDRKWSPKWNGKTEMINGFSIYKIPALNWFPLTHSNRITMGVNLIPGRFTNLLKDYDIIHFHEDLSFPLFTYFTRKPKIFHLHGLDTYFFKKYFLSRLFLKNVADLYICLTKVMKKDLAGLGIPEDRIRCLPNGIDTEIFRPSGKKEENLLLFVGRICFQKGLHILLKALPYLEKPVQLVIIGPPGWDSKYYHNILELIGKENRKGKHKIMYLGEKDQRDIIGWYQKASIFVLPSVKDEALGIVNLEALSCETPVVATNVGGVPEVISDGKNGMLIPPNDASKLAKTIQYLLDNKDTRIRLGREGRKWITKSFSLDMVVNKLCNIYRNLLVVD